MSEKTKFDKVSPWRLSKIKQNKYESSFIVFALIYFEYIEKLSLGPVLKYLSISWILWEQKYNMYANIIKLIWVESWRRRFPGKIGSPFCQCSPRLTRLSAVSNANTNYFLTRLDILRVILGICMIFHSHSHITWKQLISSHLEIKSFNEKTCGISVCFPAGTTFTQLSMSWLRPLLCHGEYTHNCKLKQFREMLLTNLPHKQHDVNDVIWKVPLWNVNIRRYLALCTLQFWWNLTNISFEGRHFNHCCALL